ncbi:hypothetical protein, partial [Acinetobacter baumannii]|uniref:hypothetical protein n=1 Tax=Acinetobacter baumannii TaxID=470 RepID=UPI001BB46B4A
KLQLRTAPVGTWKNVARWGTWKIAAHLGTFLEKKTLRTTVLNFAPYRRWTTKNCAFVGARFVASPSTFEYYLLHVGTVAMVVGASRRAALPAASLCLTVPTRDPFVSSPCGPFFDNFFSKDSHT